MFYTVRMMSKSEFGKHVLHRGVYNILQNPRKAINTRVTQESSYQLSRRKFAVPPLANGLSPPPVHPFPLRRCAPPLLPVILLGVFQVIFNSTSAAEMSALPKDLQLDLLSEFQILPEDLNSLSGEQFAQIKRDGRTLHRYRCRDHRIYFERHSEGILIHRVLHKNTIRDFLFRSKLPMADEDHDHAEATDQFWSMINETASGAPANKHS
jgi:mRNA-degrading endonuclease RelE of RelBE toxin-antitoxin system